MVRYKSKESFSHLGDWQQKPFHELWASQQIRVCVWNRVTDWCSLCCPARVQTVVWKEPSKLNGWEKWIYWNKWKGSGSSKAQVSTGWIDSTLYGSTQWPARAMQSQCECGEEKISELVINLSIIITQYIMLHSWIFLCKKIVLKNTTSNLLWRLRFASIGWV